MIAKYKLHFAILSCFLMFGNMTIGKQLVLCTSGFDITIEIEHPSHCESSHSATNHNHSRHHHRSYLDYQDDCVPCLDVQLAVEGDLPRNDLENIYQPIDVLQLSDIFSTIFGNLINKSPSPDRSRHNRTLFYPTITVLRI